MKNLIETIKNNLLSTILFIGVITLLTIYYQQKKEIEDLNEEVSSLEFEVQTLEEEKEELEKEKEELQNQLNNCAYREYNNSYNYDDSENYQY